MCSSDLFDYLQGSPGRLAKITEVLGQLSGATYSINLELEDGPAPKPEQPRAEEPKMNPMARRMAKDRAEQIPLIQRAIEVLKATIVHADEDFALPAAKPPETPST